MVANERREMIALKYQDVEVNNWSWGNFSPKELSCPCCCELYLDEDAIDRLQYARSASNRPFKINSAHRCGIHNARVGGAPQSQHKKIAFDISLHGHDRGGLHQTLKEAGFTTFGFYQSFIHTDTRPNRVWYGTGARKLWTS